jgi:carbonic anhydrase/acetyltransferase-like protein (isoleucine patch superfamily)
MSIYEYKGLRPLIGNDCYVAESAEVIGDVSIGDGVYVGPGAKIRGDYGSIIIGEGTAVEENCVIHARPDEVCRIGRRVTLGHMCMIHNVELIDDYAVIGMGSIISDWATVGRWSVVAEGGLVKNGQEIPPGKIAAGVPVKIIGNVKDDYMKDWTGFKQIYVDLARTYQSDLMRIG